MKKFLKKISNRVKNNASDTSEPKDYANTEIISIYNKMKKEWKLTSENEPNYALAEKVFLDFNDFNQKNLAIHEMYLKFIPKSLLPYPKNYIKCAYYIYLEQLKKARKPELFKAAQTVAASLFYEYPNWQKYQENLKNKAMYDDVVFKDSNLREKFKELYGSYQISKKEYDASPSSIDATKEKLIHDFGVVPEIEEDVDFDSVSAQSSQKSS